MSYKGDDLDLRAPHERSSPPRGYESHERRTSSQYSREPVWVDDTLLACCNHAFDVALAHRAAEVRPEHLLHAMTRVEASSAALEARGVRVPALRRESATVIASDIPVGLSNGRSTPKTSESLDEVLRRAAAAAYTRNAPAGVNDVFDILRDADADLPGAPLLARHAPRRHTRPHEPPRERTRAPSANVYASTQPPSRPPVFSDPPTATDEVQNTRIQALENMVRSLRSELASERETLNDVLHELRRGVVEHRDESSRFSGGMQERLNALEKLVAAGATGGAVSPELLERFTDVEGGIESRLTDLTRQVAALSDKLSRFDRDRDGDLDIDLGPVLDRLDTIESAVLSTDAAGVRDLGERLDSLESMAAKSEDAATEANASLSAEIKALAGAFTAHNARAESTQSAISERFTKLGEAMESAQSLVATRLASAEKAVTLMANRETEENAAYTQDLNDVHEALMKLNTNQHTLAGSIDQWRGDVVGDLGVLSNKLATIEEETGRRIELLNNLSANMHSMHKVTVERYYRRNRFWYWLFGTDDWVAASWPSQSARIEQERRSVKGTPSNA